MVLVVYSDWVTLASIPPKSEWKFGNLKVQYKLFTWALWRSTSRSGKYISSSSTTRVGNLHLQSEPEKQSVYRLELENKNATT